VSPPAISLGPQPYGRAPPFRGGRSRRDLRRWRRVHACRRRQRYRGGWSHGRLRWRQV